MRFGFRVLALAAIAAASSCGDESNGSDKGGKQPVTGCTPGQQINCGCLYGVTGIQSCNATGTYDPCLCPDAGAEAGNPGGGAGGAAGSGGTGIAGASPGGTGGVDDASAGGTSSGGNGGYGGAVGGGGGSGASGGNGGVGGNGGTGGGSGSGASGGGSGGVGGASSDASTDSATGGADAGVAAGLVNCGSNVCDLSKNEKCFPCYTPTCSVPGICSGNPSAIIYCDGQEDCAGQICCADVGIRCQASCDAIFGQQRWRVCHSAADCLPSHPLCQPQLYWGTTPTGYCKCAPGQKIPWTCWACDGSLGYLSCGSNGEYEWGNCQCS